MTERQDDDEDADRQLNELVQELRLVLPGTTVLFAFLLSVPFSNRFDQLTRLDRLMFFVAFLASAVALTLLLAEAGYHRVRGQPYDKHVLVRTTSRQAVAGLAMLGLALVSCVVLICDYVYGPVVAWAVSTPLAVGALGMWFVLPLMRRWRGDPK